MCQYKIQQEFFVYSWNTILFVIVIKQILFCKMNKAHPPWGSQIGVAHGGVIGYSNHEPNYDFDKPYLYEVHYKKEESGLRCDVFMGYKFQCVEFCRRFYVLNFKVMFGDVKRAPDIWDLNVVEDLTKEVGTFPFVGFKQGGSEPPKFADLVLSPVSEHQPWGHVSVVVGVGDGYIDLAEQNYEDAGWAAETYSRRVKVENKDGNYYLTNTRLGQEEQELWDKNETIIGWKRVIFN